jgi:hypothetical protein
MKWCSINEVDGETERLLYLVENEWSWEWPGWNWVAESLNSEFGNDRSANSCRNKYKRLIQEMKNKKGE